MFRLYQNESCIIAYEFIHIVQNNMQACLQSLLIKVWSRHSLSSTWAGFFQAITNGKTKMNIILNKSEIAKVIYGGCMYMYNAKMFEKLAEQIQKKTLPGFRMPLGSMVCLSCCMTSIPVSPNSFRSSSRFPRPIPCSPVQVPSSSWASLKGGKYIM